MLNTLTSLDERANILSRSATRSEKVGREPGRCCQHSSITLYLKQNEKQRVDKFAFFLCAPGTQRDRDFKNSKDNLMGILDVCRQLPGDSRRTSQHSFYQEK